MQLVSLPGREGRSKITHAHKDNGRHVKQSDGRKENEPHIKRNKKNYVRFTLKALLK